MVERTAGVTLALVATTIGPAGAQHVVGDSDTTASVVVSASGLVDNPKLDVTELLRSGATSLRNRNLQILISNQANHNIMTFS